MLRQRLADHRALANARGCRSYSRVCRVCGPQYNTPKCPGSCVRQPTDSTAANT